MGDFWDTGFGEVPKITLGPKAYLGSLQVKKDALRKGMTRRWCPSKTAACSLSALSDTPAKSYAPELGRPKGEFRVSNTLHWVDTVHSLKCFDIILLDLPNFLSTC